jgi:hypothetical protein
MRVGHLLPLPGTGTRRREFENGNVARLEIADAGNEAGRERRCLMPLLWLLVILLVIFAIVGGVAISNFLWLVLVVALVVAVLALL